MEQIKDLVLIIVAAGISIRFGSREKQLELLNGLPVFLHSVKELSGCACATVIATPRGRAVAYQEIAEKYGFYNGLHFIEGGACRSESVRNALEKACGIIGNGIVAIHDAARPLAKKETLLELVTAAREFGGAAPGKKATDTLLKADGENIMEGCIPRAGIWQIATPQVFRMKELVDAYNAAGEQEYTDDTQVFFNNGGKIKIIEEKQSNLKITYKEDLERIRSLL